MIRHADIRIYGLVQGVTFRYSAKKKADELELKGFARNEVDNSVYIEVEGEKENIIRFINWCHVGPRRARVEKVEFEIKDVLRGFEDFASIHG